MTCCAGLSALETSTPRDRSLIAATNERTTGSATSASSSAIRISRVVESMSASDNRPLPRRVVKTFSKRSESVSNTVATPPRHDGRYGTQRTDRLSMLPRMAVSEPGEPGQPGQPGPEGDERDPSERPGRRRRSMRDAMDTGRVLALSDGVFAIAATLLVLDLRVPDGLDPAGLSRTLHELLPAM